MDALRLDLDGGFKLAVDGMEMRNAMLVVEHADHNTKESRNLRHTLEICGRHNARAHLQGRPIRCARSAHSAAPLAGAAFVGQRVKECRGKLGVLVPEPCLWSETNGEAGVRAGRHAEGRFHCDRVSQIP